MMKGTHMHERKGECDVQNLPQPQQQRTTEVPMENRMVQSTTLTWWATRNLQLANTLQNKDVSFGLENVKTDVVNTDAFFKAT